MKKILIIILLCFPYICMWCGEGKTREKDIAKVACVGNSITFDVGKKHSMHH